MPVYDGEKMRLKTIYSNIFNEYQKLVEQGLEKANRGPAYLDDLRGRAQSVVRKNVDSLSKFIEIIQLIFAYWTLDDLAHYDKNKSTHNPANYLTKPHTGQIVAIIRMLCLDSPDFTNSDVSKTSDIFESIGTAISDLISAFSGATSIPPQDVLPFTLKNNFVQLNTGEGKSVVLAITSIALALMGFSVDVACYSQHLSDRDRESFKKLFQAFNVEPYIEYGTFNKLCEGLLNAKGLLRETISSTLATNPRALDAIPNGSTRSDRKKILIIDEVDVFFSKSFYGAPYKPVTKLESQGITALIRKIWDAGKAFEAMDMEQQFQEISKWAEYETVISSYSCWKDIIQSSLQKLLQSFSSLRTGAREVDYKIIKDQIFYEVGEELTSKIIKGYETLFAYLHETQEGNITETSLLAKDESDCFKNIYLVVVDGFFSYAELPKNYKNILGITGTLEYLSLPDQGILADEYKVDHFSYIPSVFERDLSKPIFDPKDTYVISSTDYYPAIKEQILAARLSRDPEVKDIVRPIIVFFDTERNLRLFFESAEFSDFRSTAKIMKPGMSVLDRTTRIETAAMNGSVTLCTQHFGRGTDFVSKDSKVNQAGGLHVLQTFFSDSISEEVQIRGRTARQGKNGTVSYVLLDGSLEKYVSIEELSDERLNRNNFTELLSEKRTETTAQVSAETAEQIRYTRTRHESTVEMFQYLYRGEMDKFYQELLSLNK